MEARTLLPFAFAVFATACAPTPTTHVAPPVAAPAPAVAPAAPPVPVAQSTLRIGVGESAKLPKANVRAYVAPDDAHAILDKAHDGALSVTGFSIGKSTFDLTTNDGTREQLVVTVDDDHFAACKELDLQRQGVARVSAEGVVSYSTAGHVDVIVSGSGSDFVVSGSHKGRALLRTFGGKYQQCYRIDVKDEIVSCERHASFVPGASQDVLLDGADFFFYAGDQVVKQTGVRAQKGKGAASITYLGVDAGRSTLWTFKSQDLDAHCVALEVVAKR